MNTYSYKPGFFIRHRTQGGKPFSGRPSRRQRSSVSGGGNSGKSNQDKSKTHPVVGGVSGQQEKPARGKIDKEDHHRASILDPIQGEKRLTLNDIASMDEAELAISPFSTPSQSPVRPDPL